MRVGQKIRAGQIVLPEGIRIKKKNDFLIGSIIGRGGSEDESKNIAENSATATTPSNTGSAAQGSKQQPVKKDSPKK